MSKRKRSRAARQAPAKLRELPTTVQERQLRTLRLTQMSSRMSSGPIPDAEEMARYQQVQSDLPERIMRQFELRTEMAQAQSEHRMDLERRVVANNIMMERLGWFSATMLGVVVLAGSIYLIYLGKSLEGFSGIILALGSLLGLYVWARHDQVQEVTKKRAAELLASGATPDQLELLPESSEH